MKEIFQQELFFQSLKEQLQVFHDYLLELVKNHAKSVVRISHPHRCQPHNMRKWDSCLKKWDFVLKIGTTPLEGPG